MANKNKVQLNTTTNFSTMSPEEYEEWKRKQQTKTGTTNTANTSNNTTTTAPLKTTTPTRKAQLSTVNFSTMSPEEYRAYTAKEKEKNKYLPVKNLVSQGDYFIKDVQKYYSTWSGDQEKYNRYISYADSLLQDAEKLRLDFKGDTEANKYLDELVARVTNGKKYVNDSRDFYSQWKDQASFDETMKLGELYEMSTGELEKHLTDDSPIAYTTSDGRNITWQSLYDEKKQEEDSAALWAELSSQPDFQKYSSIGRGLQNPQLVGERGLMKVNGQDVGNPVAFTRDNYDVLSSAYGHGYNVGADMNVRYLTNEEYKIYNYYLGKGEREKADEYLKSLERVLESRENEAASKDAYELSKKDPVAGSLVSVATNLMGGVEHVKNVANYGADTVRSWFDDSVKPELKQNIYANMTSSYRSGVQDQVDWEINNWDAFDFIYSSTMSGVDSLASGALFGPTGAGVSLGLSAAASTANDALNRGMSNGQALLVSTAAGVFEGLFEKHSLGNLRALQEIPTATLKDMALNMAKTIGVNASEEAFTEIANISTDLILSTVYGIETSQFDTLKRQYMQADPEMSEGKAGWKAAKDLMMQVVEAGLSGGFMGLGFGAMGNAASYGNASNIGKVYNADPRVLVDETLTLDPNNKLAQNIQNKLDNGKKISNAQIGELVWRNDETIAKANREQTKEAAKERLTELGESSDIDALSEVIAKQSAGEELTRSEENLLINSLFGYQVSQELQNSPQETRKGLNATGEKLAADVQNQPQPGAQEQDSPSAQTIEELAEKYGPQKEAVLSAYRGSPQAQDPVQFEREFSIAHQIGKEGGSRDYVMKTANLGYLTEAQRELAYDIGASSAKSETEVEKVSTPEKRTVTVDDSGESTVIDSVEFNSNGQMLLRADNGEKYLAEGVSHQSEDIERLYDTVGQLTTDAKIANTILAGYSGGISAKTFTTGIRMAQMYGKNNIPMSELHFTSASKLSPEVIRAAYEAGQLAGKEEDAIAQRESDNKKVTANSRRHGVFLQVGNDVTKDFNKYLEESNIKLNAQQNAGISVMNRMAESLGVEFRVFESYINPKIGKRVYIDETGNEVTAPNGFYKNGVVYIDLYAGADGRGTMLFTVAHELTHYIKQNAPEKFRILANHVVEQYHGAGVDVDKLVGNQMQKAKNNGREMDFDSAFEEVVADSMEAILVDGKALEMMTELKKKDKTLWQMMVDWFKKVADAIRDVIDAYSGISPDSHEGRMIAEMQDTIEEFERLYAEALVDATSGYSDNLIPGEESVVVNEEGDPVAYSTSDNHVMLSMRTYEEDGRSELRKYLTKLVKNDSLTETEMEEMMTGIEDIYNICKEFKDKYAPFSSWSGAAVVRDTYGKPVFSVVTPNGDYKMNLDFSLVCKKRRTLDAVFNEMSRRGIIDDFELGQKSVVKINEIIRNHGLETACALCFVDAKRFRQASMADQFTSLYNELVKSLVPEENWDSLDYFNFAGYETIKQAEDGVHTWKNSEVDFTHINEVMRNYGKGTVEHKAARYIKNNPEGRRLLLRGDFMSSQGFDAVKTQNRDILKLYNSKKGTGGPKAAFGDVQYMNEIIKKARSWTPAKAYSVGGVRIQSFSDYVPRMVFDYVQMIYDLAATKLPAHAYTKEELFVKQFGLTGVKINMSLIPAVVKDGMAPGLDANGNYVWAGESFDYETAKQIQNAEGYSENCGTICVGVSEEHIRKLLNDPEIKMVIPYHKSGLNPIVAHMNKIGTFRDYTNDQRTKGKDGKALSKDFDFNQALHKMGQNADPKAVADEYLKWCVVNGYTPRFVEFAAEENYYKLLEDFTLYDKNGSYAPQRGVKAVFPTDDSAFGSMKSLIESGLEEDAIIEGKRDSSLSSIVDEIEKSLPRTEAEIAEEQVDQADRDLEAGVKYSVRDIEKSFGIKSINDYVGVQKAVIRTLRAEGFFDDGYNVVTNLESGMVVEITKGGIEETFGPGNRFSKLPRAIKLLKLATVRSLPQIIKTATIIEDNVPNAHSPTSGVKYAYLRGTASVDREDYDITVTVRKSREKDIFWIHEVRTEKKKQSLSSNGGIEPWQERTKAFASKNTVPQSKADVNKYSDRNAESISNRALLAKAFESVTQNEIEAERLTEYKAEIDKLNAEEDKLRNLNSEIKEISFGEGKRDKERLEKLRTEAQKTANRISVYDKRLLRLEASKPLMAVLEREKKKAYSKARDKGKAAIESYKGNIQKAEIKAKIRKKISALDKVLNRGTKQRNVKEEMRDLASTTLMAFDTFFMSDEEAGNSLSKYKSEVERLTEELNKLVPGTDEYKRVRGQIRYRNSKIRALEDREKRRVEGIPLKEVAQHLANAYREVKTSKVSYIQDAYDVTVQDHLDSLGEVLGNTMLDEMTVNQADALYRAVTMVYKTISTANKLFAQNISQSREEMGEAVMSEFGNKKRAADRLPGLSGLESYSWNNEKPVYAFERAGSKTMTMLYENIRRGIGVAAQDLKAAQEYAEVARKKFGYQDWNMKKRETFSTGTGLNFDLDLGQMMSIYAYYKREAARDHLTKGGIVFAKDTKVVKEKGKIPVTMLRDDATTYQLSPEVLSQVIGKLSSKQKEFVDAMQRYLSTTMGAKGNEVSMALYGINMYGEENYFPMKVAPQYQPGAQQSADQKAVGETSLKSAGFTHSTVAHASAPIIITDFMKTWSDHVSEMSNYHGLVLPLEDFRRVWEYKSKNMEGENSYSVKSAIQNAHGSAAERYFSQLYKDLNGGIIADPRESGFKGMVGKMKKGAVMASLSVTIQQPSAIGRAFSEVNPRFFAGFKVDKQGHKAAWEQMKKYAPVTIIKEIGYFDTSVGRSASDFLQQQSYDTLLKKGKAVFTNSGYRDELLSKAPAKMDEITWVAIWEAVKRETAFKHKDLDTKSEEFLKLAGERFTEVIDKTQVYDSVLSRSGFMRSKSGFMSMVTSFMAEPTTTINMMEQAVRDLKNGKTKKATGIVASVFTANVLNAAFVSIIRAMLDDDEDETWGEKYLSAFTSELLDSMNPLTYLPWVRDIWSACQGYDIERSDMTLFTNAINTATSLVQESVKDDADLDKIHELYLSLAGELGNILGLPAKNVIRDIRGIINLVETAKNKNGWKTTKNSLSDSIEGSIADTIPIIGIVNDKSREDRLYGAIMDGDEAYADRIKATYKNEQASKNGVRKALRENDPRIDKAAQLFIEEDYEGYAEVLEEIIAEKNFTENDVVSAAKTAINKLLPDEEEDDAAEKAKAYFTVNEYVNSILDGDKGDALITREEIISNKILNGSTESDATKNFLSDVRSELKERYISKEIDKTETLKAMRTYLGKDMSSDDINAYVTQWTCAIVNGIDYNSIKDEFLAGNITQTRAIEMRQKYGMKSYDDAKEEVMKWASLKDTGVEFDDIADSLKAGKITSTKAIEMYVKYGGYTREKANEKVVVIEFIKKHPECEDISYSAVRDYTDHCESAGVPADVFYEAWKYDNATHADVDENGVEISGSKKVKVLEYIDSLSISNTQKDSIYYAFGWAESRIYEAPWR